MGNTDVEPETPWIPVEKTQIFEFPPFDLKPESDLDVKHVPAEVGSPSPRCLDTALEECSPGAHDKSERGSRSPTVYFEPDPVDESKGEPQASESKSEAEASESEEEAQASECEDEPPAPESKGEPQKASEPKYELCEAASSQHFQACAHMGFMFMLLHHSWHACLLTHPFICIMRLIRLLKNAHPC